MRLWSLHPVHLDRAGLVAGWREALLAQAVLAGRTTGYRHHPQLHRFRATSRPVDVIATYLAGLHREATRRGYRFDESKILGVPDPRLRIVVTQGQLEHEWAHLGAKLEGRSPEDARRWRHGSPTPHPMADVVPGEVESWERA